MLFIGGTGGGGICNVRYPGGAALVCLLAAVLCGSPANVCPYLMSTAGGLLLWVVWRGVPFRRQYYLRCFTYQYAVGYGIVIAYRLILTQKRLVYFLVAM